MTNSQKSVYCFMEEKWNLHVYCGSEQRREKPLLLTRKSAESVLNYEFRQGIY